MSVSLSKCAFGCENKRPEDFNGHTYFGEPICGWCAGMWQHDNKCCQNTPDHSSR